MGSFKQKRAQCRNYAKFRVLGVTANLQVLLADGDIPLSYHEEKVIQAIIDRAETLADNWDKGTKKVLQDSEGDVE